MVELINFSIKNYKSIKDSGLCFLDKKVTVFAGKNEAGKTSILEALESFNYKKPISDDSVPILSEESQNDKFKPEIRVLLSLDNNNLTKLLGVAGEGRTYANMRINVTKIHPDTYQFETDAAEGDSVAIDTVKRLNEDKTFRESFFSSIVPNFIIFKTFDDILPNQIALTQLENNTLIKDLRALTGLNFAAIQANADPRKREIHRQKINIKFTEDYKEFWSQDAADLYFTLDSNNIYFWFKEGTELYKPEMRSKGRQWHLSFYIRMTARSLEDKANILLIDEPGLFLHAKAQKDILRKLDECASRHQILYSTHSPYLIERDKLSRVRLVFKEANGTVIRKITADADKETLSPILTAIGEDLTSGIRVDRPNSIILEGYSDYLWLSSFRKLLNISKQMDFVPAVGADGEVHVGAILFGWGLSPIFLLDNDQKGKSTKKKLVEALAIDEDKIVFVSDTDGNEIEDLFSARDKERYATYSRDASKFILATQFYNKIKSEKITLSDIEETTKENFTQLFSKIGETMDQ